MSKLELPPEIKAILQKKENWYYQTSPVPLFCKKCNSPIPEEEIPLLLWNEENPDYMISFHIECVFPNLVRLDKRIEEDNEG